MNEKGRKLQSTLPWVLWSRMLSKQPCNACVWTIFWATPTCLELQGVHCAACWPGRTELPAVDHCPEGSREGEGSGDSEGGGSGGCKAPCCCYPPTSLMIRCQHRCAPHLSWRCGWQRLGSRHIPSPWPASPEAPSSWPVFCDEYIEHNIFICESYGKLTIMLRNAKIHPLGKQMLHY